MRIVLECLKTGKGKRKKEYFTAVELKPSADHDIGVEAKLNLKLDGLFAGKDYEVGRLYEFHLMPLFGNTVDLADPNFVMTRVALRLAAEQIKTLSPDKTNEKGKPATVEDIERELLATVQKMPTLPPVSGLFVDMPAEGRGSEGDQTPELVDQEGDRVITPGGELIAILKPEGEDEESDRLRKLACQYSEREDVINGDVVFIVPEHYGSYFRGTAQRPNEPSLFQGMVKAAAADDEAKRSETTLTLKSGDKEVTVKGGDLAKAAKAAGKAPKAAAPKAPAKKGGKK